MKYVFIVTVGGCHYSLVAKDMQEALAKVLSHFTDPSSIRLEKASDTPVEGWFDEVVR